MGQKVNPISFRLPITKTWASSWFKSKLDYSEVVIDDLKIHRFFKPLMKANNIKSVKIDRYGKKTNVIIHTSRAVALHKKQDELQKQLSEITSNPVELKIFGNHDQKLDAISATLVGMFVAIQIEKRASYVRVIKKALADVMKTGLAAGIKIKVSGRLSGAEIARTEKYVEGTIPLQEMRANIDYALVEANTIYGVIGIKVWVNIKKQEKN